MPLYEYECLDCGKRTELLQRIGDAPPAACPQCGGPVKKLLSSPSFQFKGSGWYVTDYAGKKGGAEAKSEGKSDDGGKTDKPAGKADKKEAATESKGSSGSKSSSSGGSDS